MKPVMKVRFSPALIAEIDKADSRAALARKIEILPETLKNYYNGRLAPVDIIKKLCTALELPVDQGIEKYYVSADANKNPVDNMDSHVPSPATSGQDDERDQEENTSMGDALRTLMMHALALSAENLEILSRQAAAFRADNSKAAPSHPSKRGMS